MNSKQLFDTVLEKELFPIKDCDKVGLDALKSVYGKKVVGIFITCPKEEIEKRLINRGEQGESLKTRLDNYSSCLKESVYFDYMVENIDLNKVTTEIYNIIKSFYKTI